MVEELWEEICKCGVDYVEEELRIGRCRYKSRQARPRKVRCKYGVGYMNGVHV